MSTSGSLSTRRNGPGLIETFNVSDTTGAMWEYEVPAGQIIQLNTIMYRYTADGSGSTRYPIFVVYDPNLGNIDYIRTRFPNLANNADVRFVLFRGNSDYGAAAINNNYSAALPADGTLWLPGMKVGATDSGLAAGDTFTEIRLNVTRFIA